MGLLADLTMSRRIFLAKNGLSFCSAPLEVLISLLYWGLRAVRFQNLLSYMTMRYLGSDRCLGCHADLGVALAPAMLCRLTNGSSSPISWR